MIGAVEGGRSGNLPAEMTSFVGRSRELEDATGLLARVRLLTLTGVGGVGKTRLALRAAERVAGAYRDGVWLVELSALQDEALLAHTICEALGLRDQSAKPQLDVLVGQLADKRLLILLDTCEHLVRACSSLAEALLRAAPGVRLLVTSRQALGLPAEHVLAVPPLDAVEMGGDAVRLFAERAVAVQPRFEPSGAVLRLCRRLDGIPLAIELAAVQLRVFSPEQILENLDDRLFSAGSRTSMPRHQTLRTAIGWSHELCEPLERLLWARLSVFSGDFDLDAITAVCGHEPLTPQGAERALEGLIEKSIVLTAGRRYRMLDTLRVYGREWLAHLGQEADLRRRHLDHYLGLARWFHQEWKGPDQIGWSRRMSGELANIRAAFDHCWSDPREHERGLDMAGHLVWFWVACGYLHDGRLQLDRALARCRGPSAARTAALWACACVAMTQGDHDTAEDLLAEGATEARAQDDEMGAAYILTLRAGLALLRGDLTEARVIASLAERIHHDLGDPGFGVLLSLSVQALALLCQGGEALEPAEAVVEQMWRLADTFGGRWLRSYADHHLASVRLARGDIAGAAALARRCLETKWRLRDHVGTALALDLLARIAVTRADGTLAARLLGLSHQVWRAQGAVGMGSPAFAEPRRACEEAACALVGDHAFDAAFAQGTRLNLDTEVPRLFA
ncbi:NB-ARC domain-containing protein [Nonomuraea sp. NPDC046570]|uniref:ATP-binding protein n=1 Tax=Nonomuraea sp. NPDC046570 TaxID=3155255 RepID=UPI0033F24369